jgi:eukaryotic-like serine/threonine-protein kinase
VEESEARVTELAGAVLDGTPIDWTSAEATAGEVERPLLEQLRIIDRLADLHRRLPLQAAGAPMTRPRDHESDVHLWGHLRVLERIGRGAFGDVYRAWDTRLDREVALKLLDADRGHDDSTASSIIEEGRLLARVHHPNIVTIYGAEQIDDRIGLWMELVRGRTLKQLVDDGKVFSEFEAVRIGAELCLAVAAVHEAGLLHRDVKAQNVMLADGGRIVLMDFGTGRELADHSTTDLAGTPLYLAPEILVGREATVQSDVYSLGVLLYHLVTGSFPIVGQSVREVRGAHERNEQRKLIAIRTRSTVSRKLARVIDQAIDPRPDVRYRSAAALADALAALRPRQILVFTSRHAVAAAVILVAGIGWEVLGREIGTANTPSGVFASATGWRLAGAGDVRAAGQPVIAVLPFKNLSSEPESNDFVDGLTDEIIQNLAVLRGLQVRSSTSSFAFKNKPRNLRDVASELGANFVVEGSVLRSGDKLRITAQLVQVAGDTPLWSERFDRELKDVFAIQDDISRAIVDKLRLTLGKGQRRYDMDVQTYELYLKGRVLLKRRDVPNLEAAADVFQQVIAKDARFAPAYAGLANADALMAAPASSTLSFITVESILRPAATRAHDLDPLLAEAQAAMGWMYANEHDWADAEQAFQRAIQLNPGLTETYTSYSTSTLQPLAKFDEGLRVLQIALRNDPLSLDIQREIGILLFFSGRYGEAIESFRHVLAVDPKFPFVASFLGRALTQAGRLQEAVATLEGTDGRNLGGFKAPQARRSPWLAQAYVLTGRRAEAVTIAAENQASPSNAVTIYAALGDRERALAALEQVAVIQPHHFGRILRQPELGALRDDPRVAALRERFGLPPY